MCIARAMVQEPYVLLLDEPTSSLDLKNQLEIMYTIRNVLQGHHISVVMTIHELNMAFSSNAMALRSIQLYLDFL